MINSAELHFLHTKLIYQLLFLILMRFLLYNRIISLAVFCCLCVCVCAACFLLSELPVQSVVADGRPESCGKSRWVTAAALEFCCGVCVCACVRASFFPFCARRPIRLNLQQSFSMSWCRAMNWWIWIYSKTCLIVNNLGPFALLR